MAEGEALGVAVVSRMLFTVADVALAVAAGLSGWWLLRGEQELAPGPAERDDEHA
jgi:hypothetical protein